MSKQEAVVPKKKRSLMELMKRREGQKALVIILFMFIPLLLLIVFTYVPFIKMVQFSFYDMKYIGERTFVGIKNYIDVFQRDDIFGSLFVSLYYMGGAVVQLALALFFASLMVFKVKGASFFKGAMFFRFRIKRSTISLLRQLLYGDIQARIWFCFWVL